MDRLTYEELFDMLISHYDSEDLVKLLEITPDELLTRCSDILEERGYKLGL